MQSRWASSPPDTSRRALLEANRRRSWLTSAAWNDHSFRGGTIFQSRHVAPGGYLPLAQPRAQGCQRIIGLGSRDVGTELEVVRNLVRPCLHPGANGMVLTSRDTVEEGGEERGFPATILKERLEDHVVVAERARAEEAEEVVRRVLPNPEFKR